jgi:LytR cell envelope-related transcriptional attenuator
MKTISFALSVHHFISSVGADAGFAAFIAVALLVLLFFSQARETANLRRRADEAGQRVQQLEGQLDALSEQVAAMPAEISVVRAAGARVPLAPGIAPAPAGVGMASAFPPAAPAGLGAPALAAATRLIPDPVRPFGEEQPAVVGLIDEPTDQATEVHAPPVTVSGGNGNSSRAVPAAATMQRPVQARPGAPSRPGGGPPRGAQGRPTGGQARPGGPPRSTMAVRPGRRSNVGRVFIVLAVLLLAGVVVTGVLVVGNINHGSSESKSSAEAAARARAAASRRTSTAVATVKPFTVTVAVLNGTDTAGLAGAVSNKLGAAGYQKGFVGNFTASQTQSATSVLYMRGAKRDATAVATALKLRPTAVQPIDQSTQQIACPPSSGPCKSSVVVTVGSDLANLATQ